MKFLTFYVRSTQLTVKLKSSQSSQMTTKSHTLAYSGLTSLDRCSVSVHNPLIELDSFCDFSVRSTLKLKSSQMTTKSHKLASSGLTSLYRCSVSVHNPLCLVYVCTTFWWSFNQHYQLSSLQYSRQPDKAPLLLDLLRGLESRPIRIQMQS